MNNQFTYRVLKRPCKRALEYMSYKRVKSSNGHDSIAHQPLTALEQRKTSRHRSLWVVVAFAPCPSEPLPLQNTLWDQTKNNRPIL